MTTGDSIIGKRVIAFDTGEKLEKIQDVLFDGINGKVLGLLLSEGGLFSEAKVLPLKNVQSVGEDAVIVSSEDAIIKASDDLEIKMLLDQQTVLKGLRVMTEDGKDLGVIKDMQFDEKSGAVTGYIASGGIFADMYDGRSIVPVSHALKLGEDVAFVPNETIAIMEAQVGGIKAKAQEAGHAAHELGENAQHKAAELTEQAKMKGYELQDEASSRVDDARSAVHDPENREKAEDTLDTVKHAASDLWHKAKGAVNDKVEDEKIKRAVGRPAMRVVMDMSDQVIVNTGDIITYAAIEKARTAGTLDILLSSADTEKPELTKEEHKA